MKIGEKSRLTVQRFTGGSDAILESLVEVFTETHVLKHPLQLAGVFKTTRLLDRETERENLKPLCKLETVGAV